MLPAALTAALPTSRALRVGDAVVRTAVLLGLTAAIATPTIMVTGAVYIWIGSQFVWNGGGLLLNWLYSVLGFALFIGVYTVLYEVETVLGGILLGTTGDRAY